jgi:hypothetical protein
LARYPGIIAISGSLEDKAEWQARDYGMHLYIHGVGDVVDLVSAEF